MLGKGVALLNCVEDVFDELGVCGFGLFNGGY